MPAGQKKIKLINLKFEDFLELNRSEEKRITCQPARLIPTLKTGDEMALTSIFLSALKLVKEFRDKIFKEINLKRNGKIYYYTEVGFPGLFDDKDLGKKRIDGLIIVVLKNVIQDAAFFEIKHKTNELTKEQIGTYLDISNKLDVTKFITVSNDFVSDSRESPLKIKPPKAVNLFHFSWTYIMTLGQLLLFENNDDIEDSDQVEIMREALHYFENPISGVRGYLNMKPGWKALSEKIDAGTKILKTDEHLEEAVLSWYEEEKDAALLLSRKIGVFVNSTSRNKDSIETDKKKFLRDEYLKGRLTINGAVSDIDIICDFPTKSVSLSISIIPDLNKKNIGRISWLRDRLATCKSKNEELYKTLEKRLFIEADIKFTKNDIRVAVKELEQLGDLTIGKEIQSFKIVVVQPFNKSFTKKEFIKNVDNLILDYYQGIVQNLKNWQKSIPKINESNSGFED